MCLYTKLIRNPKYKENKKNNGNIPELKDERVLLVPIKCGNCIECHKQKAREWKIRLSEEIKRNKNGIFITLTFSNKSIKDLVSEIKLKNKKIKGYDLDNSIATLSTRRFLERWRKETKKSVKHWLITEIGHKGTENIHLHGIIFTDKPNLIKKHWKYGYIWDGQETSGTKKINYVSEKTINYITKYITKKDLKNKHYKPIILCSPGIGKGYETSNNAQNSKYKKNETKEYYRTRQGNKLQLPVYYRNKIYTEEERELLWIEKLNKELRYVNGEKAKNFDHYLQLLEYHRKVNLEKGYGTADKNYKEKEEAEKQRNLTIYTRIKKTNTP